ncbi:hypothetical protein CN376_23070 [Bacillus cereus]|uniref:hypothetical protein n=1 Tax=Bacillus cereus TaxID=1396 RepID=UPI000BF5E635|nr:hypothetical protein [Bacillus cereus]PEZ87963.1 hypothetical protein CN376_23070 [Bacillus cereus]PFR12615.1 hypothetical protein COK30_13795 [Bacillus cereus]
MRLMYDNDTPRFFLYPEWGQVEKDFIADVLDKDLIAALKDKGFVKAPPFKGTEAETNTGSEEEITNG